MSTTVGVFDQERHLEEVLKRLHEVDLQPDAVTVLDPVSERSAQADGAGQTSGGAGDAVLPGAAPSNTYAGVAAGSPDGPTQTRRSFLRGRIANEEAVDYYCRVLDHDGSLVVVDATQAQAEDVVGVMRRSGASRVDVYG